MRTCALGPLDVHYCELNIGDLTCLVKHDFSPARHSEVSLKIDDGVALSFLGHVENNGRGG